MEENETIRYFNFPIQLLEGFMEDSFIPLLNILSYCLYVHSQSYDDDEYDEDEDGEYDDLGLWKIRRAADYYLVTVGDPESIYKRGSALSKKYNRSTPHCGLNRSIYWDYRDNHKTDFQKICLLAFLSIKSIIGNKKYCKITNDYWLSRMAGLTKACKVDQLPQSIKYYATEYKLRRIKNELRLNWHLASYSRQIRGFYVSFSLPLEDLVFEAEKNREKVKLAQLRKQEDAARIAALERLKEEGTKK